MSFSNSSLNGSQNIVFFANNFVVLKIPMKKSTSFSTRVYQLLFIYTLLVYGLTYFVPTGHWVAGFLMMSLPILLIFHLFILIVGLVFWRKLMPYSLIALLGSFPFWARTWKFPTKIPVTENAKTISVMSYNVMFFSVQDFIDNVNPQNALDHINWIVNQDADIKCFQEFYTLSKREHFNILEQLKAKGYQYNALLHPDIAPNGENFLGVAIVSKYPIIERGEQEFNAQNGAVYADIKIGKDTIRVISIHLRSMVVRFGRLKEAYKERDYKQGQREAQKVASKLKSGFIHREEEISVLLKWIDQSPYPTLVCGDFNETPYGYSYGQVRKRLANAFEEAGSGFGFTYRNAPKFIRIDQQFFDNKFFKAIDFKTFNDKKYSDHYPVVGTYQLLR